MGREKALAFIAISFIAILFVLKTFTVLHARGSLFEGPRKRPVKPIQIEPPVVATKVAICILTRRSEWTRRHLSRQTWLQDSPEGVEVSHIFVMGEDRSFTKEENTFLAEEVEKHQDILIAPGEEAGDTASDRTKHCIYWVTQNHDFDILIKTNDDSALILSRLVGSEGWLRDVAARRDLVYFGNKHALAKVSNPSNFGPNEPVNTDDMFEFDYRGVYWPEYMDGGMYGFSRRLAEAIVKNDFRTYSSEDAMVGVWVSAFRADVRYLAEGQVLSREADYAASNGTCVVAAFRTDLLRLASMWCEYASTRTLSPHAIMVKDVQKALDCLNDYETASLSSRSQPLGREQDFQAATLASLSRVLPIKEPPDLRETGQWWGRMRGVFRGKSAAVVGTSATVDRLPLYLLQGMHTLVLDDFFRVSERYTAWAPTMYMCVDSVLCASGGGGGGGGKGGGRQRDRGGAANVEGANRFARSVFAAFYVLSGAVDNVDYWRHLRQRVNAHWFVAGADSDATGMGAVPGSASVGPTNNFRVLSGASGVAMGVEVLAYLGFSPIFVTAASEELDAQWNEVVRSVQLVASTYGTEVVYLYADDDDKLPKGKVSTAARGAGAAAGGGKFSAQEDIVAWAKKRNHGEKSARWDLEVFLKHFPVVSRLEIARGASTVDGMFPKSSRCRDADDLDRFQKAVLCSVKVSLKHFSSFLTSHVPYGPVRGTFVWAKR